MCRVNDMCTQQHHGNQWRYYKRHTTGHGRSYIGGEKGQEPKDPSGRQDKAKRRRKEARRSQRTLKSKSGESRGKHQAMGARTHKGKGGGEAHDSGGRREGAQSHYEANVKNPQGKQRKPQTGLRTKKTREPVGDPESTAGPGKIQKRSPGSVVDEVDADQ